MDRTFSQHSKKKIFPEPQRGLNAEARLFIKGTAQAALSHAEARPLPTDSDEEPKKFIHRPIDRVQACVGKFIFLQEMLRFSFA